ncbi:MAG: substrate-binding domain-containing protein [Verrucomicrobia bacterium]|nr:substrate-binding domain-containing protein [Verrucomicrobiota bacterium]
MMRKCLIAAIFFLAFAGCSQKQDAKRTLTLATTTSTRDSGLLDVLIPMFEEETGITVKVIAVGSGQALELGRRGDADALLTHAADAEQDFMNQGYGDERRLVMYNDFILVRPEAGPAQISESTSVADAFRQIAQTATPFVSRGDESGTHLKEKAIWNKAGVQPVGKWYIQAGAGMAEALRMSDQKGAYTLSDRATFLAQRSGISLEIAVESDPLLRNDYSVIIVNSRKHPHVRHEAARRFADFLISPEAEQAIRDFGVSQYGQPLFFVSEGK